MGTYAYQPSQGNPTAGPPPYQGWTQGQRRRQQPLQNGQPNQTQNQQPQQQGGFQPSSSFAQMQQQGQARPAPDAIGAPVQPWGNAPTNGAVGAPVGGATPYVMAKPPQGPATDTHGNVPTNTGTTATVGGAAAGFQMPPTYSANVQQPAMMGGLQTAVQNALNNPQGAYDLPQIQQVRSALQGQLDQQFGAQKKQLDEEMARRGIGASSIASGYYGDLAGQQAQAEAQMNGALIQNAAQLAQQNLGTALGAGNSLTGTQAQLGLGNAQLGLQGTLGLGSLGLGQNQLAQQGKIATMQDTTANRGLDITQSALYNDTLARLAGVTGLPTSSLGDIVNQILGRSNVSGTSPGSGPGGTPNGPPPPTPPGTVPGSPPNHGGGGGPGNGGGSPPDGITPVGPGHEVFNQGPASVPQGNAGRPNVPGAGTPNAPNGPEGPSGRQQGPSNTNPGFAPDRPSSNVSEALTTLASTTGVDPSKFGFSASTPLAEIDAARGLMSAIGNRQPDAIAAGMQSSNPFIRRTAYAYNMGYGSAGLPDQVAQQLGMGAPTATAGVSSQTSLPQSVLQALGGR